MKVMVDEKHLFNVRCFFKMVMGDLVLLVDEKYLCNVRCFFKIVVSDICVDGG